MNIGIRSASSLSSMFLVATLLAANGCTTHPRGEFAERHAAIEAGQPYVHPVEARHLPILTASATPDELVTYALLNNADLEKKYWDWRSAIEQIPQEGTQKTNLMITYNSMITNGATAAAMNTLGIGNDAMNNIVLPGKLETASRVALEQARAAGFRFDQARFDLRNKVLSAYIDYALTAELVRLEQDNHDLLKLIVQVTEARVGTGSAMQQDALKASNEETISTNELAMQRAKFPSQLAAINALLNRAPDAPLDPPAAMPELAELPQSNAEILQMAARENRELKAQWRDIAARHEAIARAKAEYLPDVGVNVSTDLAGVTQSLMGSVMLPVLRYQALDAGVRQAEANLHGAEAMQRQTSHDLASRIVGDLAMVRDLDRQIALYRTTLLPRARQIIDAGQNTYAAGQSSFLDLLDSQRSLISLRRMVADFQAARVKQLTDLEAALAMRLESHASATRDQVGNGGSKNQVR